MIDSLQGAHARMPVLFIGHGSPMNAIEENPFSQTWLEIGGSLPRPKAILCVSAHWETTETRVTAALSPSTIHDFSGFPPELYKFTYPAPGAPDLAERVGSLLCEINVEADAERGLDHGAWSVLCRLFPAADIPVAQLSLARSRPALFHLGLGEALSPLREEGVLILGSGNTVHNLRSLVWEDRAYPWAEAFDGQIRDLIRLGDRAAVARYEDFGPLAAKAVPTAEHFLPLLYVLGAAQPGDELRFFCEKVTLGAIAMTCLKFG